MKIAVAASNKSGAAEVSPMGARAPFYLLFNEKGELSEALPNPFAVGGGGAGFAVAKMLANKEVDVVIAGDFGPNMVGALEERGLKHSEASGDAKEAALKIAAQ
ncbi:hypothetical protein JXA59_01025 [Patescibacteria group bacterium]|nr:hypothetical protein [Patescibacteria group bacterium]